MRKNWEKEIARLATQRLASLEVTEAHGPFHLRKVAELSQKIGEIYNFTRREKELAYAAGWFHDLVRSPSEDPIVGDEEASAKQACRTLKEASLIVEEEGPAIAYAVERHDRYPEWWSDPNTREKLPETLKEKIHLALFVADKMEQNGVRIIARRSQFVAGDRLKSEKGDWQSFGFRLNKDEALVVIIESFLRLTFINPEDIYPARLKSVIGPLYQTQREFVFGLCWALNLRTEDIARLLLEKKNNQDRNILQARKIEAPTAPAELVTLLASKSKITNEKIASISDELTASSIEAVNYFSSHYQKDFSRLAKEWTPAGEKAREWRQGMVDYMK